MLRFVLPEEENRSDVLAFYEEMERNGDACIGMRGFRDYSRWLTGMRNRHTGKNLPEGYVREDFYLCYDAGRLIGVFSLKFELTEYVLNYRGHIGYAVRPSLRRHGLASQMLRQGLELARGFGLESVLCVCDEDNLASEKVILKNGGVLENTRFDLEENVRVRRYWIQLNGVPAVE